jgi:hypothetical protein
MSKYIYNPSLEAKVYQGRELEAESFFQIPANLLTEFMTDSDLIADLANSVVKMSSDGISILSSDASGNVAFLLGQDTGPKDSDNANLYRLKMAPSGWTYQLASLEVTTSLLSSGVSLNYDNSNRNDLTLKFYDSSMTELTTQPTIDSSCVVTVFDFEPLFDYEIIGGFVTIAETPTSDVRMWVIGVPDIPASYGGSKIMANGPNFRFTQTVKTDGRVAKRMTYDAAYHTNKLRFIVRHPIAERHNFMLNLEYYKV